jgi:hypothetical protein
VGPVHRAVLVSSVLLFAAPAQSQGWKHELAPYLWGAGMNGTTGIGGFEAEADVGFDDILDSLEIGFMGAYRASNGRLSVTVDTVYMGLGDTVRGRGGLTKSDIDMDQLALEVDIGYEVADRLTVFGGLRYNDLSVDVALTRPLGDVEQGNRDKSWVDPVIGARYTIPFAETWSVTLRGDVGGFGVGSDFAWQGMTTLRWQASPRIGVLAAYRYIDMDYEDGQGRSQFLYDMAIHGPAVGIDFTF